MKLAFQFFLMIFFAQGCKAILKSQYQFNRTFPFTEKKDYLEYLKKNYSILPNQVLYLDSSSQTAFFNEITQLKLAEYYGGFINDSTEILKSKSLSKNLSCIGLVLKEINKNSQDIADSLLINNNHFRKYRFLSAKDDKLISINSDKGVKILLLYGYAMGSYFDNFFKEVSTLANSQANITIYIISLDPLQMLH